MEEAVRWLRLPERILAELGRDIAEHGVAITVAQDGHDAYLAQPAGCCIEPEDDAEIGIVLDAVRQTDEPWLTLEQARERLRLERQQ